MALKEQDWAIEKLKQTEGNPVQNRDQGSYCCEQMGLSPPGDLLRTRADSEGED